MNGRWFLAALLAGPALGAAQDLPQRKAGLWDLAMQMPGMPVGAMSSQHCIDAKTDAELQRKALSGEGKHQCKPPKVQRSAAAYEVLVECTSPEGKTTIASRMTGDFASRYSVDTTMRFDPPRHGQSSMQMKIDAQHKGACPAGMAPGEIRMGAMNFNPTRKP